MVTAGASYRKLRPTQELTLGQGWWSPNTGYTTQHSSAHSSAGLGCVSGWSKATHFSRGEGRCCSRDPLSHKRTMSLSKPL